MYTSNNPDKHAKKNHRCIHLHSKKIRGKNPLRVSTIKVMQHAQTHTLNDLVFGTSTQTWPRHAAEHAQANREPVCVCVWTDRMPKPSWSLSKYGHMVSLCGERVWEWHGDGTWRVFLLCPQGRPQRAETSYPPRTCVPFPKLKRLAFLTLHISTVSRSKVSRLGYVMMRLSWQTDEMCDLVNAKKNCSEQKLAAPACDVSFHICIKNMILSS